MNKSDNKESSSSKLKIESNQRCNDYFNCSKKKRINPFFVYSNPYHPCILCEALLPTEDNLHKHLATAHHVSESCIQDIILLSQSREIDLNHDNNNTTTNKKCVNNGDSSLFIDSSKKDNLNSSSCSSSNNPVIASHRYHLTRSNSRSSMNDTSGGTSMAHTNSVSANPLVNSVPNSTNVVVNNQHGDIPEAGISDIDTSKDPNAILNNEPQNIAGVTTTPTTTTSIHTRCNMDITDDKPLNGDQLLSKSNVPCTSSISVNPYCRPALVSCSQVNGHKNSGAFSQRTDNNSPHIIDPDLLKQCLNTILHSPDIVNALSKRHPEETGNLIHMLENHDMECISKRIQSNLDLMKCCRGQDAEMFDSQRIIRSMERDNHHSMNIVDSVSHGCKCRRRYNPSEDHTGIRLDRGSNRKNNRHSDRNSIRSVSTVIDKETLLTYDRADPIQRSVISLLNEMINRISGEMDSDEIYDNTDEDEETNLEFFDFVGYSSSPYHQYNATDCEPSNFECNNPTCNAVKKINQHIHHAFTGKQYLRDSSTFPDHVFVGHNRKQWKNVCPVQYDTEEQQTESSPTSTSSKNISSGTSRTNILPEQHGILTKWFKVDSVPSKCMLEEIAREVKLPKRVVQVWFQNNRARERRTSAAVAMNCSSEFAATSTNDDEPIQLIADSVSNAKDCPIKSSKFPLHDSESKLGGSFISTSFQDGSEFKHKPSIHEMSGPSILHNSKAIHPIPNNKRIGSKDDQVSSLRDRFVDGSGGCLPPIVHDHDSGGFNVNSSSHKIYRHECFGSPRKVKSEPLVDRPLVTDMWKKSIDSECLAQNSDSRVGSMQALGNVRHASGLNNHNDHQFYDAELDNGRHQSFSESKSNEFRSLVTSIDTAYSPSAAAAASLGAVSRTCFANNSAANESHGFSLNGSTSSSAVRRFRTQMTPLQVRIMKVIFMDYKTPTMPECEALGKEIGLQKRVVQVWFQNARAKEKKNPNHMRDELVRILSSGYDLNSITAGQNANGTTNSDGCKLCSVTYDGHDIVQRDHLFSSIHIINLKQCFYNCQHDSPKANTAINFKQMDNCCSDSVIHNTNNLSPPTSIPQSIRSGSLSLTGLSPLLSDENLLTNVKSPGTVAVGSSFHSASSPTHSKSKCSISAELDEGRSTRSFMEMASNNTFSTNKSLHEVNNTLLLPQVSNNVQNSLLTTIGALTNTSDESALSFTQDPNYDPDIHGTPLRILRIPLLGLSHIVKMIQDNSNLAQYTEDSSSGTEIIHMGVKIRPVSIDVGYVCKICQLAWPNYKLCLRHVLVAHDRQHNHKNSMANASVDGSTTFDGIDNDDHSTDSSSSTSCSMNDVLIDAKLKSIPNDHVPLTSDMHGQILKIEQLLYRCEQCGEKFTALNDISGHKHCSPEQSTTKRLTDLKDEITDHRVKVEASHTPALTAPTRLPSHPYQNLFNLSNDVDQEPPNLENHQNCKISTSKEPTEQVNNRE